MNLQLPISFCIHISLVCSTFPKTVTACHQHGIIHQCHLREHVAIENNDSIVPAICHSRITCFVISQIANHKKVHNINNVTEMGEAINLAFNIPCVIIQYT